MGNEHTTRLALLAALGSACVGPTDPAADPATNAAPEAALRLPVIAPVGLPIDLDASASLDADHDPLTYFFEVGDGTAAVHSGTAIVSHTYEAAGLYTVYVRAIDLDGAEGNAAQDITVIDEYPAVPDYCHEAVDCVVGDECSAGVCYSNGGGLD
ncbi:MAG: PKD domain-containing protein [Myxococcota bacterium]